MQHYLPNRTSGAWSIGARWSTGLLR